MSTQSWRTTEPCAELCISCGRLAFPDAVAGYRTPSVGIGERRCIHCQGTDLVDLSNPNAAQVVLEIDQRDYLARSSLRRRLAHRIIITGAVAVLAGLLTLFLFLVVVGRSKGRQVDVPMVALTAIVFGIPLILVSARKVLHEWRRSRAKRLPARWSLQLPPRRRGRPLVTGPISVTKVTLVAPITGRPCVAYGVGVHRVGTDHIDTLGGWQLLEQRSTSARVGTHVLESDEVHLRLKLRRVTLPPTGESRDRADAFLRARGFLGCDSLCLFESVILPGDIVSVVDSEPLTLCVESGS